MVRTLRQILDLTDACKLHEKIAIERTTWADGRPNLATVMTAKDYQHSHRQAISSQEQYLKVLSSLVSAYDRLVVVQRRQNGRQVTITHTTRKRDAEEAKYGPVHTVLGRLKLNMDGQEVPQHPAGTRKMPITWLSNQAYSRINQRVNMQQRTNNTAGLDVSWGRWRAWRDLEGGLGAAWLWVKFNQHDRVMDVSNDRAHRYIIVPRKR